MEVQRKIQTTGKPVQIVAERLIYWKRDLPLILGVSGRTIDRWLSSSEFPDADVTVHGRPVWRRETIQSWCGAKKNA